MLNNFIKIFLTLLILLSTAYADNLDLKIGQMIIVGFNGDNINSLGYKKILKQAKQGQISGVILFSKNIKSKDDLIKMNETLINSTSITPFISIDNEGGYVQRYDFYKHKSAYEISKMTKKEAQEEYSKMAQIQKELKINLNFAPCVDLAINPNSIITLKERSYGTNPDIVSDFANIFIKEHNNSNIATSIKHFPGHGSVEGDTHKGFVDATKTFKNEELKPYYNLKNSNELNMVMVSHIYSANIDDKYPASLSKKTIKGLLKDEIGFKGMVVSDDYDMGAIRKNYTLRDIVVNSINAGVDILLFSNNIEKNDENLPLKIQKIIKKEIELGNIDIEDIENSYKKIVNFKEKLNH